MSASAITLIPILIISAIIWLVDLLCFASILIGDVILILAVYKKNYLFSWIQRWRVLIIPILLAGNIAILMYVLPSISIPIVSSIGHVIGNSISCSVYPPFDILLGGPLWIYHSYCPSPPTSTYTCLASYAASTGDLTTCYNVEETCQKLCILEVAEKLNGTADCNRLEWHDVFGCKFMGAAASGDLSPCLFYDISGEKASSTISPEERKECEERKERQFCLESFMFMTNFSDCSALSQYKMEERCVSLIKDEDRDRYGMEEYCEYIVNGKNNCAAMMDIFDPHPSDTFVPSYRGMNCFEFCEYTLNPSEIPLEEFAGEAEERYNKYICLAILNNFSFKYCSESYHLDDMINMVNYRGCDKLYGENRTYCFNHNIVDLDLYYKKVEVIDCSVFTGDALEACNDALKVRAYCEKLRDRIWSSRSEDEMDLYYGVCLSGYQPEKLENMTNNILYLLTSGCSVEPALENSDPFLCMACDSFSQRKECLEGFMFMSNFSDCDNLSEYGMKGYCEYLVNAMDNCPVAMNEILSPRRTGEGESASCFEFCEYLSNSSRTYIGWTDKEKGGDVKVCLAILNNFSTKYLEYGNEDVVDEINYKSCDIFQGENRTYCFNRKIVNVYKEVDVDCSIFTGDALEVCNDALKVRAYCEEQYNESASPHEEENELFTCVCTDECKYHEREKLQNMTNDVLETIERDGP